MAVVTWSDHIEIIPSSDETVTKVHEELTVLSWDELASHDCSKYLQGSIAYNITEHLLAVWDGSSAWIDTDGTSHTGGSGADPSDLYFYYWESGADPSRVYSGSTISVDQREIGYIACFESEPDDEMSGTLVVNGTSSDSTLLAVVDESEDGYYSVRTVAGTTAGTVVVTVSVPSKNSTATFNFEVADGK